MAYAVGEVIPGPRALSKYLSASEDFSAYGSGVTTVGELRWDEPRAVVGVTVAADVGTTLANGTNSKMSIDILINPESGTWRAMALAVSNTANITGTFNGFTWANAATIWNPGCIVQWSLTAASTGLASPICYGIRMAANISAGDTTLTGVLNDIWLSAHFEA